MSLKTLEGVILSAYDAGRITMMKAAELIGTDLLSFRDKYAAWRDAHERPQIPPRRQGVADLIRLNETAQAVVDGTDDGDQFATPDPTLVENLARALALVDPEAAQRGIAAGLTERHARGEG